MSLLLQNPLDVTNFDEYKTDDGLLEYPDEYPDHKAFAEWGSSWVNT